MKNSSMRCCYSQVVLLSLLQLLCPGLCLPASGQGAPSIVWANRGFDASPPIALAPNGKALAVYDGYETLLYSVSNGHYTELVALDTGSNAGAMAFSPNGQILAIALLDSVELWNAATGTLIGTLATSATSLNTIAFSSDGNTLAVGGQDYNDHIFIGTGIVEIWSASSISTFSHVLLRPGASYNVASLAFSPDNTTLAIGGESYNNATNTFTGVAELWTLATAKRRATLPTNAKSYVNSAAFSPDGKTVAVGGRTYNKSTRTSAGVAEIWAYSTDKLLTTLPTGATVNVNAMAFSPDGTSLALGGASSTSGIAELWNVSTGKRLSTLPTAAAIAVSSVAFTPDSKTLALAGNVSADAGLAELWSTSNSKRIASIGGNAAVEWQSIAVSPDGKMLAVGGGNTISKSGVQVWDATTSKFLMALPTAATNGVNAVAFSSDDKTVAVGGESSAFTGIAELWNAATGKLLFTLPTSAGWGVTKVAFSPDGKTLAVGGNPTSYSGVLELWNVATGQLITKLPTSADGWAINAIAFSPDGSTLAVGGHSNTATGVAELWNVSTGKLITTLATAANEGVSSMAFSPDGKSVAIAGQSYSVRSVAELWSISAGYSHTTLPTLPGDAANLIAFSPDGKSIFIAGDTILVVSPTKDTLIRYWDQFTSYTTSLTFTPDGLHFLYTTNGGLVVEANNLHL